ncbi:MAG: acyl-CoA dehydratase activase-related protein [Eubacteriales bacterium]
MIVGIPKGLFYYKYHQFLDEFLNELNIETITSEDTNKNTLNKGIQYAVDEACLPVKIFHGHVFQLIGYCDMIVVPRIMQVHKGEYICPKICGLPEMIIHSIPNLPMITTLPIYLNNSRNIYHWCLDLGKKCHKKSHEIKSAYQKAYDHLSNTATGIDDKGFPYSVGLLGHSYNIYDTFSNMDIIKKLNHLDIGVITEEKVNDVFKNEFLMRLTKKPFWSFARDVFASGVYFVENKKVDGLVILSSFQCGIDSVMIDLIKDYVDPFPVLVLKIDEHSGEAGVNTRLEAFTDMLKRRSRIDHNISAHG